MMMLKKDLAKALHISASMVSRLAKLGMPTDSVAGARRWRECNLETGRMKDVRIGHSSAAPAAAPRDRLTVSHAREEVEALMEAAGRTLRAGQKIDAMVPLLRSLLRAIPPAERAPIGLDFDVVTVLAADVLALLPPRETAPLNEDGTPVYTSDHGAAAQSDDDVDDLGKFWYQVAAGEIVVNREWAEK